MIEPKNVSLMKFRLLAGLVIGGALLAPPVREAQAAYNINKKFSFQGAVSNLADGVYGMKVTIDNGTSAPEFEVTDVTVRNGLFSLQIDGNGGSFPLDSAFFSPSGSAAGLHVDLAVHTGAGDVLFPNVPITSVPSAFVADKANISSKAADYVNISGVIVWVKTRQSSKKR
jgi:hypothetical protein